MSRYFTAQRRLERADSDDWFPQPLLPDLYVPEHGPVDTGLVDIRGAAIMRAPNLMGFGRDGEW
jgi:hypothetical protein